MKIEYNGNQYNKIKELLADTTIANIDKFLFDNEHITLANFVNLQEQENKKDASGSASNSGARGSASNSDASGSASNSGASGSASNSGASGSASNSGYWGSASNSGYWGSASNSGARGSASNSGASGSASNSGYRGSASNSGYWGSASNSGASGSASNSGDWGSASNSGDWGISSSNAIFGTVSNKKGCFSFITEFVFNDLQIGEGLPKEKIIKQNAKCIKFTKQMDGKFYTLFKNKIYEVIECDNIKMIVLNKKQLNGYNIVNGIEFGDDITIYNKQRKLEDIEKIFVVEKDGIYSHGETVEQAIKDFRYKINNRDTSDYEYFKTTKEKIAIDEIIKGYRVITGSCEFGTKQFVESLGELKEAYTIKEALKILKSHNAYRVEMFENFVKGKK